MRKKFILSLALTMMFLVALCSLNVSAGYYGKLTYTTSNGEVTITDCNESATEVEIPATLGGLPVTKIARFAFDNCTKLESVIIPDTVTDIETYAFNSCSALTEIAIPASVVNIKYAAFSDCYNLQKVDITDLSAWCMINFENEKSNPVYYARNLYVDGQLVTNIDIPAAIKEIKDYTFYGCDAATSVTMSNEITAIGIGAFYGCYNLESITIPSSVTSIGGSAFSYCSGLKNITIPSSVTSIGGNAFSRCSSLESIVIQNGVTSIGASTFNNCFSLTYVEIPESVTTIDDTAFWGCSALTSIAIPSSVTHIGAMAFRDCTALERVDITDVGAWCTIDFEDTQANPLYYAKNLYVNGSPAVDIIIPDDVTCIQDYAFYDCINLKSVTISDSVQWIDFYAFSCPNLESVTFGNSIESILNGAFFGCSKISTLIIPDSITMIGYSAFDYCTGLETVYYKGTETQWAEIQLEGGNDALTYAQIQYNYKEFIDCITYVIENEEVRITGCDKEVSGDIVIPETIKGYPVTSIGLGAFYECNKITGVTIPDGVNLIKDLAFAYCTALKRINIPMSVTYIDSQAFLWCECLERVDITNMKKWCEITFYGDSSNPLWYAKNLYLNDALVTKLTIPNVITEIKKYTFVNGKCFSELTIPTGVKSIENGAFMGCSNLSGITIPDGVEEIGVEAFLGCNSLTSIEIPVSVTSIGDAAFYACGVLADVYYGGTEEEWGNILINSNNEPLTNANIHYNDIVITPGGGGNLSGGDASLGNIFTHDIAFDGKNWTSNLTLFSLQEEISGNVYVAVFQGNEFKNAVSYTATAQVPVGIECEKGQIIKIFWWNTNLKPKSLKAEITVE